MIVCSSVFILLAFAYPNQIMAENKQSINYTYQDLNSQTLPPQLTIYDLSLKDSIKDNKNEVVQDLLKQLL